MINKAEMQLIKRPAQVINHLRREQQALKTRQLLGGDNIVFDSTTPTIVTIPDVPAGGWQHIVTASLQPINEEMLSAEVAYTVYLDTDNDPDRIWPQGADLDNDEIFNVDVSYRRELAGANDATGYYEYTFRIVNNSAAVHDFYIHLSLYTIKAALS